MPQTVGGTVSGLEGVQSGDWRGYSRGTGGGTVERKNEKKCYIIWIYWRGVSKFTGGGSVNSLEGGQ